MKTTNLSSLGSVHSSRWLFPIGYQLGGLISVLLSSALLSSTLIAQSASIGQSASTGQSTSDQQTARLGVVTQPPSSGFFVEVQDGFMIPYTATIPGTNIQFDMVPIPGGTFVMGSPDNEPGRHPDEGPTVKIAIDPMWVGKTEVRWQQYKEYMRMYGIFKSFESQGIRPVQDAEHVDAITAPTELYEPTFTYEFGEDPMQPAVTMTPYAAKQFTKWLSRISGPNTTGPQYRLPTEAEWEYVARGGTTTPYSWAVEESISDYAWFDENSDSGPSVVGQKKPNPFGLHDMHGNVAEWTVSEYDETGYQELADRANLTGVSATVWPTKPWPVVARGGSWEMPANELRSAARLASDDKAWKGQDPNFPRSPWWFTNDPTRGVGFRLFRSYQPLPPETITKFWDASNELTKFDVQSRLIDGRGGLGLADETLPAAIEAAQSSP